LGIIDNKEINTFIIGIGYLFWFWRWIKWSLKNY
jgi:hypothetical protein